MIRTTNYTPRERQVLYYLAQGFTKNEIGERMKIKQSRLNNILTVLRYKTGANNSVQLMAIACSKGIIQLEN